MKMQMSNFYTYLLIMFITSFLIQYFLMSWIMSNSFENITNSVGKFYLSVLMGLFMVLIELIMTRPITMSNIITCFFILILIGIFITFYKKQIFIGDKEYVSEMVEHHSMAVLTSEEILKKTKDPKVANLASNIVETQTKEIQEMKELIATYA